MRGLSNAREYFAKDRFATEVLGIAIDEMEEGYARCSMLLTPLHRNAEGAVMGGVLFTLADFAFAVAANYNQPVTVTLSCHTAFLRPPRGGRLSAEARRVRQGRSACFYQVAVSDGEEGPVALVTVSGFVRGEAGEGARREEALPQGEKEGGPED